MDRTSQVISAELEAAKIACRDIARSGGYDAYIAADNAVRDLEAELKLAGLAEKGIDSAKQIHLAGNTFKHKDAIKRAGGRWHALTRTWVISAKDYAGLDLPGVYTTSEGQAALATMDRADSAY